MNPGLKIKKHTILSENDYRMIHNATCRLLSELGVEITSPAAISLFKNAGAVYEDGRVKIPESLIDRAIQQTGKQFDMPARNPKQSLRIDTENPSIYFGTGGEALNVLNYKNGVFEKKSADTNDLVNIIRICDKLDNVDFFTRPVEPDVSEDKQDVEKTRLFLEHTTKPLNLANLIQLEKLPEIIKTAGDKSQLSFISCVAQSPMKLVSPTVEKFMEIVKQDIPVAISSCPQGGTTAPLSEPGELIQLNAEILSVIVLANLVKPGAKVLYRGIPITANLHLDGSPRWSQPDSIRRVAAKSGLTGFYNIPCCGTTAVSDEKDPNAQNLSEKALGWVFEAACGAQYINSALGMMEQVMTVSPEQYIMDDMALTKIKKLFRENPDYDIKTLAETAVNEVLQRFGAEISDPVKQEISRRVDYILNAKESYDQENMDKQVEIIKKAVLSGRSSNIFMKASRAGIRQGWLYTGERIDSNIVLEEVLQRRNELLA